MFKYVKSDKDGMTLDDGGVQDVEGKQVKLHSTKWDSKKSSHNILSSAKMYSNRYRLTTTEGSNLNHKLGNVSSNLRNINNLVLSHRSKLNNSQLPNSY